MTRTGLVTAILVFITAGATAESPVSGDPHALLAEFRRAFKTALLTGLAKGPEYAIAACQIEAPAIASRLSGGDVSVGRTSHRLRNPANLGPEWVAPVLAAYLRDPGDRSPRTVPLADGRRGYVEPIVMQSLCVTCHGEKLQAAVAEAIAERYPLDRAVGFKHGDLRGVFWVEMPAD